MLKKYLLFVFLLFIGIVDVNAAAGNNLNYDINSFDIDSNNNMKISGWSIVDHADNVGVSSTTGGNEEHVTNSKKFKTGSLRTYIVAYVLDGDKDWNDIVGDSYTNLKTCHNNKRCYVFGTTMTTNNFYFSRCTGEESGMACFKSVRDARESKVASGDYRYKDNDCAYEKGVYKGKSHCLYKNTGFSVSINLKTVYKHFVEFSNTKNINYNNIYFRIFSVVGVKDKAATSYKFVARSALLEIPDYSINSTLKSRLQNADVAGYKKIPSNISFTVEDKIYNVKHIQFKVGTNQVKVTAVNGLVSTSSSSNNKSVYIQHNQNFKVNTASRSGYTFGRSNSAFTFYKGDGSYTARLYAVKACICNKEQRNGRNYICAGNSTDSVKCKNSTYKTYFVPAVWSLPTGGFVLKASWEKEEVPDYECIKCESNKCRLTTDTCQSISKEKATCDVEETNAICKEFNYNVSPSGENKCSKTISSSIDENKFEEKGPYVYYYAIEKNNLDSILKDSNDEAKNAALNGATNFRLKLDNGNFRVFEGTFDGKSYYYIPVKLHAIVNYSQNASLKFYKRDAGDAGEKFEYDWVNEKPLIIVNSGRFFNFSFSTKVKSKWTSANYVGAQNNNINWYSNTISVYYRYKKSGDSNYTISSKPIQLQFDLTENSNVWYNSQLNYDSVNKSVKNANAGVDKRIVGIVNAYKHLAQNYNHFRKSSFDFGIDVSFFDSNEYVRDVDVYDSNPGIVTCNSTSGSDELTKECFYEISDAYVNPTNGNVYYRKDSDSYRKMSNIGSLYYVPYTMKSGEIFKFKININNLSLIKGIVNKYDEVTCEVGVEKEKLKYRTIDAENPFPKLNGDYTKLPTNWQKYYNTVGNLTRLTTDAYKFVSYRTKMFDSDSKKVFDQLNSTYGGYGSDTDMDRDSVGSGNSAVINNSLFDIINGTHCGSGYYYRGECDIRQK